MSTPNCPNCKATIAVDAFNPSTLMVQCGQCHFVGEVSPIEVVRASVDKDVEQPIGILMNISGDRTIVEVEHRHFKSYVVPLVIASILIFILTRDSIVGSINNLTGFLIGGSCFVLFLLWLGLEPLLKKTIFEMNGKELKVNQQRLLFLKKHTIINRENLVQVFVKAIQHKSENGTSTTFSLYARHTNGKDILLLESFKNPKPLYYIETQIEKALDLKDAHIEGEFLLPKGAPTNLKEVFGLMKNAYQNYKSDRIKSD